MADRFAVDVRIDIDGPRPTRRVSADYYRDGRYFGSMRVDAPRISSETDAVRIAGRASCSWTPCEIATVEVTIAHRRAGARPLATLRHFFVNGDAGSRYVCEFESSSFRSVNLQETAQTGVTPFTNYDTASLPCEGPRRELTLRSAFAEAGIELVGGGPPNVVDTAAAGADSTWSDAELQAAMWQYFTQLDDRPQWAIWLLHAWAHDNPRLYGVMFDRTGRHRQGCAVFYRAISGRDATTRRNQLYTVVHELGHGFNLLHSWEKTRARPPVPSRPGAESWMNYAGRFPGGPGAFWSRFPFQFDELELAHLRHGFEEDVIPGGSPFTGGAAYSDDGEPPDERISPAMQLRISAPAVFGVGAPVTIGIELAVTAADGAPVPAVIGPRAGNVTVLIRGPDGDETRFEPLMTHCHGDDATVLRPENGPRRDAAFLHHGKFGSPFARPGRYAIHARHRAADGALVRSNVLSIEVLAPHSRDERALARLMLGNNDVWALMSLGGSAAPHFDGANRTLDEIIERFPATDAAAVARIVRATSLARPFKLVVPGREQVLVREADVARAQALIAPMLDMRAIDRRLAPDANQVAQRHAAAAMFAEATRGREVTPAVAGYVNSRLLEIATVVATTRMRSLPRAPSPPRRAAAPLQLKDRTAPRDITQPPG
jgi:hypothetical protein